MCLQHVEFLRTENRQLTIPQFSTWSFTFLEVALLKKAFFGILMRYTPILNFKMACAKNNFSGSEKNSFLPRHKLFGALTTLMCFTSSLRVSAPSGVLGV